MSVELDSNGAKYLLVAIVLLGGIFGGIAAELFKTRKVQGVDEEGGWELRSKLTPRYSDWGGWASVLLGIVAAGVAMGLFDQVEDVTKIVPAQGTTPATTTTVEEYEVWRVVAVTLIAGFSAPKFLALAQERMLALTTQKQLEGALLAAGAVADAHAQQADTTTPEIARQQAAAVRAIADSALPTAKPEGQNPAGERTSPGGTAPDRSGKPPTKQ